MKNEKETLVDSIFPKEGSLKKANNRKRLKVWAQASPFCVLGNTPHDGDLVLLGSSLDFFVGGA